jgi:serpin B
MRRFATVVLSAALLLACGKNGSSNHTPTPPDKPDPPAAPSWPAPSEQLADADLAPLVNGNTSFAFDTYARLATTPGNIALSPASISFALAMTYAGARGDTATEMKTTLHFEGEPTRTHVGFANLISRIMPDSQASYELAIANRLWGDKASVFLPEFLTLSEKHYNARLENVDFRNDPEGARATINKWVEGQTQKRIVDLLAKGIIDNLTRLVLTNAIYFKGKWANEFDKDDTEDKPFRAAAGEKLVAMMVQEERFAYLESDDLQILELPYKGRDLAMIVVLPKAWDGLAAVEKQLTAQQWKLWQSLKSEDQVHVELPRFTADSALGLKPLLQGLGMKLAFSDQADFSGLDGTQDLYITAVVHKAFVKVDEEGAEAAAATAVVVGEKSAAPRQPARFIADHAFIYAIVDKRTETILFLGRVVDP